MSFPILARCHYRVKKRRFVGRKGSFVVMKSPEPAESKNEQSGPPTASDCPVVALGASAGGLEFFQRFFDRMPVDSGMSFVLLQHLDPRYETLMPELLAKHTKMPVLRAEDGQSLEANHVYVTPPNALLLTSGCKLRVDAAPKRHGEPKLIDHFFRSLAETHGDAVVAIVLSGTGSDGTVGLKAVKQGGGLTIALNPETTKYDSMTRSAITAGAVDYILPVEQMPVRIAEYVNHLTTLRLSRACEETVAMRAALTKIFPLLRNKTGHDFSRYKQSTMVRRIHRRMQVTYSKSLDEYVGFLEQSDAERENLFKDLLIGVTQFFRDDEAFAALERQVIPAILREKSKDGPIRVWIPGCATGEEAYSIAILLLEQISNGTSSQRIQIFATDLDAEALTVARRGRYSENVVEQISPERLKQFFVQHGDIYEVREEVRELCVFSPHNLIKDPPFSRLDLISCRNVLIYLEAEVQKKLLPIFHYALNPSGFLFLGPSENVASRSEMFQPFDQKARIFQRKPTMLRSVGAIPLIDGGRVTRPLPFEPIPTPMGKDQNIARTIERVIMEGYAPPSVIINEQGDIVYFSGRTGKYLEPSVGAPSNKLLDLAKKCVRVELRTAVHRAIKDRKELVRENIVLECDGEVQQINLIVRPLPEVGKDAGLFIVVFQELIPAPTAPVPTSLSHSELVDPLVQQLEHELRTSKEDLQTTIEELETSNEELKSANEELLSMNEELQSTNEELQTSKEEIQSINDELQKKVDELDAANADLQNLFQSTMVATIFVDKEFRITRFTPAVYAVTRLGEREIGRRLMDVAPELVGTQTLEDMQEVLRTLSPKEREMSVGGGQHWFFRRIIPYRSLANAVEGLVLTFSDVTALKQAEAQRARLAAIVEGSQDAIIGHAPDGVITSWNTAAQTIYGYSAAEAIGKPISLIAPPDKVHEMPAIYSKLLREENVPRFDTKRVTKDGRILDMAVAVSPVRDDHGRITGFSSIGRDITELLRAAEQRARLASIVESSDDAIISKSLEGIVTSWNRGAERIFGYTKEEMVGQSITKIIPLDRLEEEPQILARLRQGERVDHFETIRQRKNGELVDVSVTISPVRDSKGRIVGASKIARDITEQKKAARAMRDAKQMLESQVAERTAHLNETVRSLEGVCYTMAHDLRAPLRSLHGYAQILMEDYSGNLDSEGKVYTGRMVAATAKMEQLIHDLLEFAKLGHIDLPLTSLEVRSELDRVIEALQPDIEATGAEITLPPAPAGLITGNMTVFHQVMTNLVVNAMKFVDKDVKPRVHISAEQRNGWIRIDVEDNGIGIAKEHQQRIFGLFQRLHTAEKYPGTGVGLAIVKRGVERLGGQMSIESQVGKGTKFSIQLPAAKSV